MPLALTVVLVVTAVTAAVAGLAYWIDSSARREEESARGDKEKER
jgi:hypothetical protein